MSKTFSIKDVYPKHLFWDMEYEKLSFKRDKAIVIPRALYATSPDSFLADIKKLEKIYSRTEILDTLRNTKELISNKVCELVANRYQVPTFYRYKL